MYLYFDSVDQVLHNLATSTFLHSLLISSTSPDATHIPQLPRLPLPIQKITKLPPGIYQKERKTTVSHATYDLPEQKSG